MEDRKQGDVRWGSKRFVDAGHPLECNGAKCRRQGLSMALRSIRAGGQEYDAEM